MIPPLVKDAIDRYVEHRHTPGRFVRRVLCNDLTGAVLHADEDSLAALLEIVRYAFNKIPYSYWGSAEKVAAWLAGRTE